MILTCPACDTKYVVKDGAIPAGGRQVRCASCKHSWHQDPDDAGPPAEQSIVEAALIEPRSGPEAEERTWQESIIEDAAGAVADDPAVAAEPIGIESESEPATPPERDQWPDPAGPDANLAVGAEAEGDAQSPLEDTAAEEFEPFYDPEPLDEPRRRVPVLLWVLLLAGAIAAAAWFFAPESIRARLGLAAGGGSQLEVMVTNSDRQRLASGNELFAVSGRVINPTDRDQDVPPLRAELLDASKQRVVYSWTIDPPAASLGPGASATFNSAEVDVPQGGSHLRVTLGQAAA